MTVARGTMPLAVLFATAGVLHFVVPAFFERIVPPWVPDARLAVQLSGVAELLGAAGVLWAPTRVAAAWGLIALLLAVFPANIHMLNMARVSGAGAWTIALLAARLPLQVPLIWWVWRTAIARHPNS